MNMKNVLWPLLGGLLLCASPKDAQAQDTESCYNKAVLDQCRKLYVKVNRTCQSDFATMLPRWHKRLAAMPSVQKELKAFLAKHSECLSIRRRVRVRVGSYSRTFPRWKQACDAATRVGKCARAMARSKQLWEKTVARVSRRGSTKQCRFVLQHNSHPLLGADDSKIRARLGANASRARKGRARRQARIANTRCPRARYRNKRLHRRFRALVQRQFSTRRCRHLALPSSRRKCRQTRVKVRAYRFLGAPKTSYNRWKRRYTQYIRAAICVRKKKPKRAAYCMVHVFSFTRTRTPGSAWTAWRGYGAGAANYMLCKNLP